MSEFSRYLSLLIKSLLNNSFIILHLSKVFFILEPFLSSKTLIYLTSKRLVKMAGRFEIISSLNSQADWVFSSNEPKGKSDSTLV